MNLRWFYSAIVLLSCTSLTIAGESPTISIGKEIHRQISDGEIHRYHITLNEHPIQIVIKPNFYDVAVSVRQLYSKKILRANSPPSEISDEFILFTPNTADEYVIEIEGVSQNVNNGDYTLMVTRPSFSPRQLKAAKLTTEAAQIRIDNENGSNQKAINTALQMYRLSAIAWQKAGNDKQQSRSLKYVGLLALDLGELQTAETSFTKALSLEQESDIHYAWVRAYLGIVKQELNDYEQAEEYFRQALSISRTLNDQHSTASFLNYLGLFNQTKNLPVAASNWYEQALEILEHNDFPQQKAQTLSNIGGTHYQMGGFKEALAYYQRALKIHEHLKDHNALATVLGNIASLYRDQGDLSESLIYNLQTLQIYKNLGDINSQNLVYHRLGILFHRMGDYQRSEVYFQRSYEGRKASNRIRHAANSLRSMGLMYSESGNVEKAIQSQTDALSLFTQIDSKVNIARTQVALAASLIKSNKLNKAKKLLDKALPVLEQAKLIPEVADALMQLGNINSHNNNSRIAELQFKRVLNIQRYVFDPIGEIDALVALAKLEKSPHSSLKQLQNAENVALKIYQGVANPALKARFSATLQNLYDRIIETNLSLHKLEPYAGYEKLAFMASERNRGRSLLELLSNSEVAASSERSELLEKQKTLRRRLNGLWYSVNRFALRNSNSETKQLSAANKNDIADVMTQLDNLTIQLNSQNKADLKNSNFSLEEIQASLSHDELLLHIHLGVTKSAIWIISQDQISVIDLPSQSDIETLARDAYNSLLQKKFSNADKTKLANFTKLIIQEPKKLLDKRNIYVVADGFLQYIPFGALIDESNNYWVQSATFLNLTSSRSLLNRNKVVKFNKETSLLVYSDPIFGDNDFRAQASGNKAAYASVLSQAANQAGIKLISRLPFSSIEAAQIARSIPSAKIISGYNASKQDIFDRDIETTEILHFATHGIVNDNYSALSGLIFSLIDRDRTPLDGFLSAADISTLPMSPKLVVLSACETGIGEVLPGEGLLSLARVFLSQGAENVVSSLWRVDDQATAELMGHFYHALIERQYSIALALRYAQQQIASQAKWSAPYYWAGFIISSTNPGADLALTKH